MKNAITGLVLAGGAGTRMGGIDKGLALHQGEPLVSHVIAKLTSSCAKLMISCNRNIEQYRRFGYTIIKDDYNNGDESIPYQGPIAGIVAALPQIDTEYLLISPCDTPNIPSDLAEQLFLALSGNTIGDGIAIVHDGLRRQNLHCLIHTNQLNSLMQFYHSGGRALKLWYENKRIVEVDFSSEVQLFTNINCKPQNV